MPATPDSIVLIHGLWMSPRSCDKCSELYDSESRAHNVLAPGSLVTQCDGRL